VLVVCTSVEIAAQSVFEEEGVEVQQQPVAQRVATLIRRRRPLVANSVGTASHI